MTNKSTQSTLLILIFTVAACGGREASEIQLRVAVDSSGIKEVRTDLGYQIEVLAVRAAIGDIEFAAEGEEHDTGTLSKDLTRLVPSAYAHPGHSGGGLVIGELPGNFIVDWLNDGLELGTARVLAGRYEGANFRFRKAGAEDELAAEDPLLGHTFHLVLRATQDEKTWEVDVTLDLDDDTYIVGAPFAYDITTSTVGTIGIKLLSSDPFENDTLFDGIEFAPLDDDNDGRIVIEPGQSAHNQIRRLFGAHDFYFAELQ